VDALVILLVAFVLLLLLLAVPWRGNYRRSAELRCLNNLKQVALAFHLRAQDNGDWFPMTPSTNTTGAKEFNETEKVYLQLLAMSDELGTPKILTCPADKQRVRVELWSQFTQENLSYFLGLEANTNGQMILAGDRNITGGVLTNGNLMLCKSNTPLSWTSAIHKNKGNIALGDASVRQVSNMGLKEQLQAELQTVTTEVIRFAIP
jgi:hypothetical protein